MIETYTPEQQRAIEEKIELLRPLTDPSKDKIREIDRIRVHIHEKRMKWLEENYDQVSNNLNGCRTAVEKAFRLVFFEYMKINPGDLECKFFPEGGNAEALFIKSRNFCPYSIAFQKLGSHSTDELSYCGMYCKMFLEESVEYLANEFLQRKGFKYGVIFGRNYKRIDNYAGKKSSGIRPVLNHCQEYFLDERLNCIEVLVYKKRFRFDLPD
jgi:hypothetical protein